MPRIPIADLDDPRLVSYRNLKATNTTRGSGRFVVEGQKLVERLLESSFPTDSVLTTDRNAGRVAAKVPAGVPHYIVPEALIDGLVGFPFHQGALACGIRQPRPDLDAILGRADQRLTLLLCPRMDNPENLGALIRLGDVFGIAALVVGERCPDPLSRRVLRVSMGTALRLPVLAFDDLAGEVARIRVKHGITLAAAVTDPDALPFDMFERPDRLALVLGSESAGLAADWVVRCDHRLTIPMRPGADSLNLAVAAGILLYHLS